MQETTNQKLSVILDEIAFEIEANNKFDLLIFIQKYLRDSYELPPALIER